MRVERLHLRLFLEGVEIPCVSASVTMTRNSPATAMIQIVPTPIAFLLLPRTVVHLFYSDDTVSTARVGSPSGDTVVQADNTYQQPSSVVGTPTVPNAPQEFLRYRLLFTGEVVSLQYQKTPMGRAVILQCLDDSNYWDSVLHDRRGGLFPPTRMARLQGIAQGAFYDLLAGDTGAIYDKLSTPPSSFPHLTGYMAGIMHLMEEVFGTYHRRAGGGQVVGSKNPFATMAELRLRLMQQVGVPPGDSTPLRLMRNQGFGTIWRRGIRGLPAQFSFRALMNSLMQYTFYGVFPLTTPRYVPPTGVYAQQMGWARALAQEPEETETNPAAIKSRVMRDIKPLREAAATFALLYEDIQRTYLISIPMPTSAGEALRNAQWARCNTVDARVHPTFLDNIRSKVSVLLRSVTDPERWGSLRVALRKLSDKALDCKAALTFQRNDHAYLARTVRMKEIQTLTEAVLTSVDVSVGSWRRRERRRMAEEAGDPAFLYTQIFSPDIWFCPPPRCNVFFPDQIRSMSSAKNFLAEPTRLLIRGYSAFFGSDPLFDRWYFAPTSVGLLRERPIARSGGSVATGDSSIANDLMEHEIYTGIIPSFQKLSDREMTMGRYVAGAGRDGDQIEGQALDYFQKVTNFLFFKTRFAARTLSVTTIFNPYVIPGMPGLAIDAPTDQIDTANNEAILRFAEEQLQDMPEAVSGDLLELLKGRTGVHHLGMVESVTHSINASGEGSTSVALTYARDHRESVEFFGADVVEARRRRRVYREVRRRLNEQQRQGLIRGGASLITNGLVLTTSGASAGAIAGIEDPEYYQAMGAGGGALIGVGGQLIQTGVRGYTTERQLQTTKVWTVACFTAPEVGSVGPWGGPITEVRDVSGQYTPEPGQYGPEQAEIERLDREISRAKRERDDLSVEFERASTLEDTERILAAGRALDAEIQAYETRKSALLSRRRRPSPRRFSLFGVYNDGRRLPSASIQSDLIGLPHPAREFGPDVVSYVGDPNQNVTLFAYEIVEDISEGADRVDFPIEDAIRPPWYPEIWLNSQIGGAVYLPLFGTGAVTDPLAVVEPGTFDALPGMEAAAVQTMYQTSEGPQGSSGQMIGSILNGATVQGAVDFLVHTYSQIRFRGFDSSEFVRQYVYRPVATLFDLFGSADLEISGDGTVTSGVEGFHSRAFGPYSDLFGLAPADTTKLLGIEEGDVAARARLDVRGRRHAIVTAYQQELQDRLLSRG